MKLSPEELRRAAMACRVAAHQLQQDADKQSSPSVQQLFESEARPYLELATKFEKDR